MKGATRPASFVVRRLADVMAVEAVELGEIEPRRRAADRVESEPFDRLLGRDDLRVAVAPAQPQQIVPERLGQIAHGAVFLHAQRAVALRHLLPVGPVDQRDMGETRHGPAQRPVDLALAEGVVEMVVAADDMGDRHVEIVHHHREIIGGRTVGAQDDEIVQLLVRNRDLALHQIGDGGDALLLGAEPDHRLDAGRRILGIAVAPGAVIAHRLAGLERLEAHRLQFLGRAVAVIGLALRQELLGDFGVAGEIVRLMDDLAVPAQLQPAQSFQDRVHGLLG